MTDFHGQGAQHGARKRRALSNATASSLPTHGSAADALGQSQFLLGMNGGPTSPGTASLIPRAIPATAERVLRGSNAFLPGQALSQDPTLDFDSDLGTNIDFSGNVSAHPLPGNNAIQRYTSEDRAPWNPVNVAGVSPTTTTKNERQRNFPGPYLNVQHHKTSGSESGTHMDSGYYSNPTQSHIETQSINSGTIGDMARGQHTSYRDTQVSPQYPPSPQNSASDISPQNLDLIPAMQSADCPEPGCTWVSKNKTQSELKKHKARHTSDHICYKPNCPRNEKGFATLNDLDRHVRSVHKETGGLGYKCYATGCSKAEKLWPRRDNFRHHLESIHPNADTDYLLKRADEFYEAQKIAVKRQLASEPDEPAQNLQSTSLELGSSQTPSAQHFNFYGAAAGPRSLGPAPNQVPTLSTAQFPQLGQRVQSIIPGRTNKSDRWKCIVPDCTATPFYSHNHLNHHYIQEHSDLANNFSASTVALNVEHYFDPFFPPSRQNQGIFAHGLYDYPGGRANTVADPQNNQARLNEVSSPLDPPNTDFMPTELLAQIGPNLNPEPSFTGDESYLESIPTINISREEEQDQELSAEEIKGFLEKYTRQNGGDGTALSTTTVINALKSTLDSLYHSTAIGSASSQSAHLPGTEASGEIRTLLKEGKTYFCCPDTRKDGTPCEKSMTPYSALTKHRKRHARPYGCTVDMCYQRFGSKNDWKRHELTRHLQQECWICPRSECLIRPRSKSTPADGTPRCQKLFYDSTEFTEHLRQAHKANDRHFQECLQKFRLGRRWEDNYWCGFCRTIKRMTKKSDEGSAERFNHIDEHFTSRDQKRSIGDWMPAEGTELKSVLEQKDKKNSLVPKENKDESSSDDEADADENDEGRQVSSSSMQPNEPQSTAMKRTSSTAFPSSSSSSGASLHAMARSRSSNVSLGAVTVRWQTQHGQHQRRRQTPHSRRLAKFRECCWCKESTLLALGGAQCQCSHQFCENCTHFAVDDPVIKEGS